MKYKNYLQDITKEQEINIKKLKRIIKKITDINIDTPIRKQEVVRARKIYFKILRKTTRMSLAVIAGSVGKDHATALHALKDFDFDYKYDPVLKEMYDSVYDVFVEGRKLKTIDDIIQDNLKLQDIISDLKSNITELRNELKETRRNNIRPRNQQATIYKSTI